MKNIQPVNQPANVERLSRGFMQMEELRKKALEHLKYWSKAEPSESGIRVAELLERWQGLHHMNENQMRKAEWNTFYVRIRVDRGCSPGCLATFDFGDLTTLVFLAHDMCIRVQIGACNMQSIELMFHPRDGRNGVIQKRHPTIETALAQWRERNPLPTIQGTLPELVGSPAKVNGGDEDGGNFREPNCDQGF